MRFSIPVVVWYYVVIPVLVIMLIYMIFNLLYRKNKGTYYYNYVVDYVYSTLGILFCILLLSLLLGYSIATFPYVSLYYTNNTKYLLYVLLVVMPLIPSLFLFYNMYIFVKNLKRKKILDQAIDERRKKVLEVE